MCSLAYTLLNLPRKFWKDTTDARDRFLAELNAFRTVAAPPETETSERAGRDWEPQGREPVTVLRPAGCAPCACGRRVNDLTAGAVQFKPNPPSPWPHPLHDHAN